MGADRGNGEEDNGWLSVRTRPLGRVREDAKEWGGRGKETRRKDSDPPLNP